MANEARAEGQGGEVKQSQVQSTEGDTVTPDKVHHNIEADSQILPPVLRLTREERRKIVQKVEMALYWLVERCVLSRSQADLSITQIVHFLETGVLPDGKDLFGLPPTARQTLAVRVSQFWNLVLLHEHLAMTKGKYLTEAPTGFGLPVPLTPASEIRIQGVE